MNARAPLFALAAALVCAAAAEAACPAGEARCAKVDLNGVPEITQQIVAQQSAAPAQKPLTPAVPGAASSYTGPTFGVSDRARRAPVVGYRWAIE